MGITGERLRGYPLIVEDEAIREARKRHTVRSAAVLLGFCMLALLILAAAGGAWLAAASAAGSFALSALIYRNNREPSG